MVLPHLFKSLKYNFLVFHGLKLYKLNQYSVEISFEIAFLLIFMFLRFIYIFLLAVVDSFQWL